MPHYTGWLGRSSSQSAPTTDKAIYPRSSSSVVRYQPQTIRRGNQELVIHHVQPSRRRTVIMLMLGAVVALIAILVANALISWWQGVMDNAHYGYPRTSQLDAIVGHNDSIAHPSHFLFQNWHGHILIIEYPGGDALHSRVYSGPVVNSDLVPVTGQFDDETGNHSIDMVVFVGGQRMVFLNDGSTFHEQQ